MGDSGLRGKGRRAHAWESTSCGAATSPRALGPADREGAEVGWGREWRGRGRPLSAAWPVHALTAAGL